MGQRQAQLQIGSRAQLNRGLIYGVVQHMAAGRAFGINEVNVAARYRNALLKYRGAEAADDAVDVAKTQLLIAADRLGHGRIGLGLLDHRAGDNVAEPSRNTHRIHVVGRGLQIINKGGQLLALEALGRGHLNAGDEIRRNGEGSALVEFGDGCGAITAQLVADAVEDDHLPVQRIEGTDTEIALSQKLADGHLAVVDAVQ